jgi:hypothetical protein
MNTYHRYLKLPFEFKKPDFFDKNLGTPFIMMMERSCIDKNFIDWIAQFNVKISNVIEAFYTPANGGALPIHADYGKICDITKLNFTWGPDNSLTRWWKVKDEKFLRIETAPFKYPFIVADFETDLVGVAHEHDCDKVFEKVIDRPSLMNVGQLHSTYNPGNQSRWTLSFTLLNQDNSHLIFAESLKIFKEVIDEYN